LNGRDNVLKFLIIEDDEGIRLILRKILSKNFSCTIQEASDGKKGLDILQNNCPDIILLDINMPIMDGKETLDIISSHSMYNKIPVIIISALGDKVTVGNFIKKGIVDYLLKPLDLYETVKRINRVLQNHLVGNNVKVNFIDNDSIDGSVPRLMLVEYKKNIIDEFNQLFHDKFAIFTAKNGIETIEKFNSHHPRYIVVSDKIELLDKKIILQKVRETADQSQVSIYLIVDDRSAHSAKIFNFDGIIRRSDSKEDFKKDLLKVVLKEEPVSQ
jgi:DNA-binding response OmpR family regulator